MSKEKCPRPTDTKLLRELPLSIDAEALKRADWVPGVEQRMIEQHGHAEMVVPKSIFPKLAETLANDTIWSFEIQTLENDDNSVIVRIDDPNMKAVQIIGGGDDLPDDYVLGYDRRYAQVYEAGGDRFEMRRPNPEINWLFQEGLVEKHSRVIDLGCGEGRDSLALAAKNICEVTAVDISPHALQKLSEDADAAFLTNLHVVEDDIRTLEKLPDEYYDVAINMGALHMLARTKDRQNHLTQVFRVLQPGGLFLVKHAREWLKGFRTVVWSKIDQDVLRPGDVIPRRIWLPDGTMKEIPMELIPHKTAEPDQLIEEVVAAGFQPVQHVLATQEGGFGNSYSLLFQKPYEQGAHTPT